MYITTNVTLQDIIAVYQELHNLLDQHPEAQFAESHNDEQAIHLYIEQLHVPEIETIFFMYTCVIDGNVIEGELDHVVAQLYLIGLPLLEMVA